MCSVGSRDPVGIHIVLSLLLKIRQSLNDPLFLPLFTSHTHKLCLDKCVVSILNSVTHQQRVSGNQRTKGFQRESNSDRKI